MKIILLLFMLLFQCVLMPLMPVAALLPATAVAAEVQDVPCHGSAAQESARDTALLCDQCIHHCVSLPVQWPVYFAALAGSDKATPVLLSISERSSARYRPPIV